MHASRAVRFSLMGLSFATLTQAPSLAWASACNQEVVAPVRFAPGAVCWSYRGAATTFVGAFGPGQTVAVRMAGQADSFDPQTNKVVSSWQARTPEAEGPGGFSATAGDNNILTFRTPASGVYRIGFSPCAMWGGQGAVQICAR